MMDKIDGVIEKIGEFLKKVFDETIILDFKVLNITT
jgi:hypothetical protein